MTAEKDPLLELTEATLDFYYEDGARPEDFDNTFALDRLHDAVWFARAAGYPARREAERRVFEAAQVHRAAYVLNPIHTATCRVCLCVAALDAVTPKEPTDG